VIGGVQVDVATPALDHRLLVGIDWSITRPSHDGSVMDPRLPGAATYSIDPVAGDSGVTECVVNYFGPGQGEDQTQQILNDLVAITKTTGHPPTDTAFTCCDARGMTTIYIGLANQMAGEFRYNPPPSGATRLPNQAVRLYEEWMKLNVESVQKNAGEDHSKGYALSSYPPLRAKQLTIREYALGHKELLQQVALRSADSNQRAIAIEILGYARRSRTQISTLVTASRDPNEGVRNNALRALGVLAKADPAISKSTPANNFIDMLNSGIWTDRNKASHLVVVLSRTRDPRLLHQLRVRALSSLIEMARWRDPGHADDARMILGRVAGLPEEHLVKLIANGDVEQIVAAAQRPR